MRNHSVRYEEMLNNGRSLLGRAKERFGLEFIQGEVVEINSEMKEVSV